MAAWTFTSATPLGTARSRYEITAEALVFTSDDVLGGGSETLRWEDAGEGCTAAMAGMGGRGAPDLPGWVPQQLEWLVIARAEQGASGFMRRLPEGDARTEIVDAVRLRLGATHWIGERIPLQDAQRRLGIAAQQQWGTAKVVGIVAAVLGLLVLSLLLLGLLLTPVVFVPLGLLTGAWFVRRGLLFHRASAVAESILPDKAAEIVPGPVRLEGVARTTAPSLSAVTARSCVWWDVSVALWYEGGSDEAGEWRHVAARHGGEIERVELEDDSGRIPVWLKDAELLLEQHTWESGRDTLPPAGVQLLDALGFPWDGSQQILVTEERLEADATLYVFGTLDARRNLPEPGEASWGERIGNSIRSGDWRRDLVGAAPAPLRTVLAVFVGFIDMMIGIGTARKRRGRSGKTPPPVMPLDARVVWKGRGGLPLIVSDRPAGDAMAALRRRALVTGGIGVAIILFVLWSLFE
ncbi:MAG: hypothetical protein ABWZ88_17030 [Variovorax sp.]